MKRSITIILMLVLYSCMPSNIKHIDAITEVSILDFTKYSKEGFLITPNDYLGKYESIGVVSLLALPEADLKRIDTGVKNIDGTKAIDEKWVTKDLSIDKLIEYLYLKLKKMGANALVQFEALNTTEDYDIGGGMSVKLSGIRINGYAIKRIE